MKATPEFLPAGSQTVGPYFRIGFDYFMGRTPVEHPGSGFVEIHGQVLDRDGLPVPDALLEFWDASHLRAQGPTDLTGFATGFKRAPTDDEGRFSAVVRRPLPATLEDGSAQASHLLVLVFMRGLLRNLVTRLYFADAPENTADPVLSEISVDRRATLIAQPDGADAYAWNVILQGQDETVFFAW